MITNDVRGHLLKFSWHVEDIGHEDQRLDTFDKWFGQVFCDLQAASEGNSLCALIFIAKNSEVGKLAERHDFGDLRGLQVCDLAQQDQSLRIIIW